MSEPLVAKRSKIEADVFKIGEFSDVTLRVVPETAATDAPGPLVLKLHKAILAASSPYFKGLFTHGAVASEIEIHEDLAEAFQQSIRYLYGVSIHITSENLFQLLIIGDKYQIDEMLEVVFREGCEFLKGSQEALFRKCCNIALQSTPSWKSNEMFLALPANMLKELLEHSLKADKSKNELHKFEAVSAWVQKDWEARNSSIAGLMATLRLYEIPRPTLLAQVKLDQLCTTQAGLAAYSEALEAACATCEGIRRFRLRLLAEPFEHWFLRTKGEQTTEVPAKGKSQESFNFKTDFRAILKAICIAPRTEPGVIELVISHNGYVVGKHELMEPDAEHDGPQRFSSEFYLGFAGVLKTDEWYTLSISADVQIYTYKGPAILCTPPNHMRTVTFKNRHLAEIHIPSLLLTRALFKS